MAYQLIISVVIAVVALVFVMYFFSAIYKLVKQSHYVYHPKKEIIATPSEINIEYEDIIFETSDGVNISGWYVPVRSSNKVILVLHGNSGNISTRLIFIDYFSRRLGLSTFIIDYRGYGKSDGVTTEKGTYLDAEAAWKYLTDSKKITPENIIIFGRSLGGPIAARLAAKVKAGALILDSTFTSMKNLASQFYPYLPVRRFFRFDYPTIDHLESIRIPVLIIHSKEDDYIPLSHAEDLFSAAGEPKSFLKTIGSHNSNYLDSKEDYLKGISSFIKSLN